jgi:hypothetical protein
MGARERVEIVWTYLQFLALILTIPDVPFPTVDWSWLVTLISYLDVFSWIPLDLDFKVQFVIIVVGVPQLVNFLILVGLNRKRVVVWYFATLAFICAFVAGSVLRTIGSIKGNETPDEVTNGNTLLIVGGVGIFLAIVVAIIDYKCGNQNVFKQLEAADAGQGVETNQKHAMEVFEEDHKDRLTKEEEMVLHSKESGILASILRFLLFAVLLVAGLFLIGVFLQSFRDSILRGLGVISLANAFGIFFLTVSVLVFLWFCLGLFQKGRYAQLVIGEFCEVNLMRICLVFLSLIYIPVVARIVMVFNCNAFTCTQGSMQTPVTSDVVSNFTAVAEGCELCQPSLSCNATRIKEFCPLRTKNVLEYARYIPCSEMQTYFFAAAALMLLSFVVGLPIAFMRLTSISANLLAAKFPVLILRSKPPVSQINRSSTQNRAVAEGGPAGNVPKMDASIQEPDAVEMQESSESGEADAKPSAAAGGAEGEAENVEEEVLSEAVVWALKVNQSNNITKFLYQSFQFKWKQWRLLLLIQKLIIAATTLYVIRVENLSATGYLPIVAATVVHAIVTGVIIRAKPFIHIVEDRVYRFMHVCLCVTAVAGLLAVFGVWTIPMWLAITLLVLNAVVPLIALGVTLWYTSRDIKIDSVGKKDKNKDGDGAAAEAGAGGSRLSQQINGLSSLPPSRHPGQRPPAVPQHQQAHVRAAPTQQGAAPPAVHTNAVPVMAPPPGLYYQPHPNPYPGPQPMPHPLYNGAYPMYPTHPPPQYQPQTIVVASGGYYADRSKIRTPPTSSPARMSPVEGEEDREQTTQNPPPPPPPEAPVAPEPVQQPSVMSLNRAANSSVASRQRNEDGGLQDSVSTINLQSFSDFNATKETDDPFRSTGGSFNATASTGGTVQKSVLRRGDSQLRRGESSASFTLAESGAEPSAVQPVEDIPAAQFTVNTDETFLFHDDPFSIFDDEEEEEQQGQGRPPAQGHNMNDLRVASFEATSPLMGENSRNEFDAIQPFSLSGSVQSTGQQGDDDDGANAAPQPPSRINSTVRAERVPSLPLSSVVPQGSGAVPPIGTSRVNRTPRPAVIQNEDSTFEARQLAIIDATAVSKFDSHAQPVPVITKELLKALKNMSEEERREEITKRYKRAQEEIDRQIDEASLYIVRKYFMICGALGFVALGLCIIGIMRTGSPDYRISLPTNQQTATSEFVGYGNWTAFTDQCCCMPFYNSFDKSWDLGIERWVCRNGWTKERVRSVKLVGANSTCSAASALSRRAVATSRPDCALDGFDVRDFCSTTFKNSCGLSVTSTGAVKIVGCSSGVATKSMTDLW